MSNIMALPIFIIIILGLVGVPLLLITLVLMKKKNRRYDGGYVEGETSKFKYLFWALIALICLPVLLFFIKVFPLILSEGAESFKNTIAMGSIFILIMVFIASIVFVIARFVYNDAKKRGMDPWLWMTVAIFIPNLIGLIIYLVARNSYVNIDNRQCINCGRTINKDFKLCPYCGKDLNNTCGQCGSTVDEAWKMCPYCGKDLK